MIIFEKSDKKLENVHEKKVAFKLLRDAFGLECRRALTFDGLLNV